jgi:pimeloyl-ACP methyl ester carboxylesterase
VRANRAAAGAALLGAVATLLAGCGGGGSSGGDSEASDSVPHLKLGDLHPCGYVKHNTRSRCGHIEVPFERRDPSLGTTKIAFAVRPRDETDRRSKGAIFAVEGGPGYGSSRTAGTYRQLFGPLLRSRELVTVDMRGTGRSDALDCPGLQRGSAPDWIALPNCARKLGPRFSSYRTSAAADDIDDVRRALGYDRITLYGDSYGTFLAQSYAYRHPDTLNGLVLDSAYPVQGESAWYPSIIATGVRSMGIACRRSPQCSGDAEKRLAKLVAFLRDEHRGVGPLVNALSSAGYNPPHSYLKIDRAGTELRHGHALPWKRLIAEAKLGYGRADYYSAMDEDVVSCNDYPLIWSKDASEPRRRAELEHAVGAYHNPALRPFSPTDVALSSDTLYQYCLTAPRPSSLYEPPVSPGDRPTRAPVLVISGELDNVTTPYEGNLVAREFSDSRQYIARGVGHVDDLYAPRDSAAAKKLRRFLHNVYRHGE